MRKVITITTDYGDQLATAQLKAVIATLGFDGEMIENHSVSAFSIIEGAFALKLLARFSPVGTVHVGVIDPGVGGPRKGIIIKTKRSWFVGPDNGLLYPAAIYESIEKVWEITESEISEEIPSTFHGRDVFIKVAVFIAQGHHPALFGSRERRQGALQRLSFELGQVFHIDHFGNIKVYWPYKITPGEKLIVLANTRLFHIPVVHTFCDVAAGNPIALIGSSQTLELAVNLGRGDRYYGVKMGDRVTIQKEDIAYETNNSICRF